MWTGNPTTPDVPPYVDSFSAYNAWMETIQRSTVADVLVTERQRCQYCAQVSENDSRGGCVACGGPRAEYGLGSIKETLVNWRI